MHGLSWAELSCPIPEATEADVSLPKGPKLISSSPDIANLDSAGEILILAEITNTATMIVRSKGCQR